MKIYNKFPGRFMAVWNAEDQVDDKGRPLAPLVKFTIEGKSQSPELPAGLGRELLAKWGHRFTADVKQIEAEAEMQRKFEESNNQVAKLENTLNEVRALLATAGGGNKKAAQAAADRLDELLKVPAARAAAPAAPAAAPASPIPEAAAKEQESFET